MTDRPRAGLIGAGFIGEVHARAIHAAGGVLSTVADASEGAAVAAAHRFRAERASRSAEELIDSDDVDVVHVCTPNHLHVDLAARALEAGKHVVCEKPLAVDLAGARRLVDLAEQTDLVTAVPFVYRFYPAVRDARQRVADGETGPLQLLHGSYLQDWLSNHDDDNWRIDPRLGGASRAFGDIGVHWIDLVEFCSGHRVVRLNARLHMAFDRRDPVGDVTAVQTEDAATVMFETDRGAIGSVVLSQVSPGRKNRLWFSLDGERASLSFNQERPDSLWIGSREAVSIVARGTPGTRSDARAYDILPAGHPQGYQDSFNGFVADVYRAVEGDQPEGLPTFADGLRAAIITDAVLRSAVAETWVGVSE